MLYPLAFHIPFMDQSFVLLLFGLLIFGKRLPEVGKSLGSSIVQFKKGLKGIEDEIEEASNAPSTPTVKTPPMISQAPLTPPAMPAEAFKFDPITGQPLQEAPVLPPGAKFDPYTGKPIESVQVGAAT